MGLIGFFKNIILSIKVRGTYNRFFKEENRKINTSYVMKEVPLDITNIYTQIQNNPKFKESVQIYKKYELTKSSHNLEICDLELRMQEFSLDEMLSNPLVVDYKEILSKNEPIVELIDSFERIGNRTKLYRKEFLNFRENYQTIVSQYKQKIALGELYAKCENMYISECDERELKQEYKSIKEAISKDKQQYYEFALPSALIDREKHNEEFISKHESDKIFDDINGRSLDKEQRRAVLCNAKSNLTIAGAGSGKTLTICGKVKYLLEELKVASSDILLLSYSNKSAKDLKEKVAKINDKIDVNTFHSLGLNILNTATGKKFTVDDSFNAVIEKYFREDLQKDPKRQERVLRYYGLYLSNLSTKKYENKGELYEDAKKSDFRTLKDQLQGYNQAYNKLETIKKENVKSFEELAIANWLFINGINYEYESTYQWEDTATSDKRQYTPDFYLPDYDLYYEHYGLDENGVASQYTADEAEEYVKSIQWKRELHEKNKTQCIETYSYEFSNGTIFKNLEAKFKDLGIEMKPLDSNEIYNAINSIYEGIAFKSFINLIRSFISLYKARYIDEKEFDIFRRADYTTEYELDRRCLFLDICKDIYLYYVEHLKEENKIDFDDMILKSMDV